MEYPGIWLTAGRFAQSFERRLRETSSASVGDLPVTDFVMTNLFWLGVFRLTDTEIDYMAESLHAAVAKVTGSDGVSARNVAELP